MDQRRQRVLPSRRATGAKQEDDRQYGAKEVVADKPNSANNPTKNDNRCRRRGEGAEGATLEAERDTLVLRLSGDYFPNERPSIAASFDLALKKEKRHVQQTEAV